MHHSITRFPFRHVCDLGSDCCAGSQARVSGINAGTPTTFTQKNNVMSIQNSRPSFLDHQCHRTATCHALFDENSRLFYGRRDLSPSEPTAAQLTSQWRVTEGSEGTGGSLPGVAREEDTERKQGKGREKRSNHGHSGFRGCLDSSISQKLVSLTFANRRGRQGRVYFCKASVVSLLVKSDVFIGIDYFVRAIANAHVIYYS